MTQQTLMPGETDITQREDTDTVGSHFMEDSLVTTCSSLWGTATWTPPWSKTLGAHLTGVEPGGKQAVAKVGLGHPNRTRKQSVVREVTTKANRAPS